MESKFLKIISEALEIEDREIKMSDNFKEYHEWDSLARLVLIAELDQHFGVIIKSDEFKNLNSLQSLYDFVQSKKE